jgi:tetratricopeptide (TPR) repeat protein
MKQKTKQKVNDRLIIGLSCVVFLLNACGSGKQLQRAPLEAKFASSEEAFAQKRFRDAAAILEELLEQRPDEIRYGELLGYAYVRLGRLAEAEAILTSISARDPGRKRTLLALAELAQRRNNNYQYVAYLEEIAAKYPRDIEARELLAGHFMDSNNLPEAQRYSEEILRLQPNNINAQTRLRDIRQRQEKLQLAGRPIDYDGHTTLAELEAMHEYYKISQIMTWQGLRPLPLDAHRETKLQRRDLIRYFDNFFRQRYQSDTYAAAFAATRSDIPDLPETDPDYAVVMFLLARDLSLPLQKGYISLDAALDEKTVANSLEKFAQQVLP